MSKNYMAIIAKFEGKPPLVLRIPKRIKDIRKIVGDKMEMLEFDDVLIAYNEELQEKDLDYNKSFQDIKLKGNIVIVGNFKEVGDLRSLTKKEIRKYISKIKKKEKNMEKER